VVSWSLVTRPGGGVAGVADSIRFLVFECVEHLWTSLKKLLVSSATFHLSMRRGSCGCWCGPACGDGTVTAWKEALLQLRQSIHIFMPLLLFLFPTSLYGGLIFCWQSAALRRLPAARRLLPLSIHLSLSHESVSTCLSQRLSINLSLHQLVSSCLQLVPSCLSHHFSFSLVCLAWQARHLVTLCRASGRLTPRLSRVAGAALGDSL